MFLKQQVFKRLLKEAYKGPGLTVGRQQDEDTKRPGYYLSGDYWIIWLDAEEIPKEAKAAIIELAGDLPAPGEVFRAYKGGGNQYEIEQNKIFDLPESFKRARVEFKVTNSLIEQGNVMARILQAEDKTNHVTAVNEVFISLVDVESCNTDAGETLPYGPCAEYAEAPFIYWGNNVCYLMAGIRGPREQTKEAEFLKYLEGFDLE